MKEFTGNVYSLFPILIDLWPAFELLRSRRQPERPKLWAEPFRFERRGIEGA
jgi:hypothetical protein